MEFTRLSYGKMGPAMQTFSKRVSEMPSWPIYVITRETCPDLSKRAVQNIVYYAHRKQQTRMFIIATTLSLIKNS